MAQINEWLSVDRASGEGDTTITLTASSSTELNDRIASLEIRGITKSVYMNVRQRAFVPIITLTEKKLHFTCGGGTASTEITSNASWYINRATLPDWISVDNYNGDANNTETINISVSANTTGIRDYKIPITLSTNEDAVIAELTITQDAISFDVPTDVENCFYIEPADSSYNGTYTIFSKGGHLDTDWRSKKFYYYQENTWKEFRCKNDWDEINYLTGIGRVYIKDFYHFNTFQDDYLSLDCDIEFNVGGDITTLIGTIENPNGFTASADEIGTYYARELFYMSNIYSASQLILPNKTAPYCYQMMFGSSKLAFPPNELPATELAEGCYHTMFYDCPSLQYAPAIKATSLAKNCCYWMFTMCDSLTTAPILYATELVEGCYENMFAHSQNLSMVECHAEDISAKNCLLEWLENVSPTGTFIKKEGVTYPSGMNGIPSGWQVYDKYAPVEPDEPTEPEPEDPDTPINPEQPNNDYFWIKLEENGDIQGLKVGTFQHSYDRINWYYSPATLSVPANTYVWFRNTYPPILNAENETKIHFTKRGSIGGNISSIGDMRERNFIRLFMDNIYLVDASELILPWDVLAEGCYELMFEGCTSLTTAPALPATTLAKDCYNYMFEDCTSLTTAPELPATTLADSCYLGMFMRCTSLTTAPALPATILAEYCYFCMFADCTSLTTAPILPATTLVNFCYFQMFFKCKNLSMVECHAEDISAGNCLDDFLYNVSPTGTFIKKQGVYYPRGDNGIPSGWTIQNIT